MSQTATIVQTKRFTVIDDTLDLERSGLDDFKFIILSPENRYLDRRGLYKRLSNTDAWFDSVLSAGSYRQERPVSPWDIWKKAHKNIDRVAVMGALDGSGKWMLDLLSKDELQQVAKKRKDEKIAKREHKKAEAPMIAKQREMQRQKKIAEREATKNGEKLRRQQGLEWKMKRAEEAKAFLASYKATSAAASGMASSTTPSNPKRSPSLSRLSSKSSSIRKASLTEKDVKISVSRRSSHASSISSGN